MSAEQKFVQLSLVDLKVLAASLDLGDEDLVGNARHKATYIVPILGAMTEETLSRLRLTELQSLADVLGVEPAGNSRRKMSYVAPIMAELSALGSADPAPEEPEPALMRRRFQWRTVARAIAAIVAAALVLWGLLALGKYAIRAYQAQRVAAAEAEVSSAIAEPEVLEPAVPEEETPEPVVAEETQETPEPTATAVPALMTELVSTEVFTYTPGGESFGQWATDVITPTGATQPCGRVWQATNLENLPWTAIFCDWRTSVPEPKIQWPHPTQMTVSGDGVLEFELWRDLAASEEVSPDPYDIANSKGSPLGLGWFVQGFNGTVCVDGACQTLVGGGVYQIGFPYDMDGHYDIRIIVDSGQVNFWQGECLTTENNWPLPEAN